MKRLLILSSFALLSGCSVIQFFTPQAPFDNAEYSELNRMYTYSDYYKADCSDNAKSKSNFANLSLMSNTLLNYSQDLPNNEASIRAVTELDKLVQTANKQMQEGTHSVKFCELKLDNIKHGSGTVKAAIAKRRR